MEITNFQIFKNSYKKEDKQPDYKLSTKIADNTFQEIGAGWKKVTGDKTYISVKLKAGYSIQGAPKLDKGLSEETKSQIAAHREAAQSFDPSTITNNDVF